MQKAKKKISKKSGIKVKTNYENNIYFFEHKSSKTQDNNYLLLEDNNFKLNEKKNNTVFYFIDNNTNKTINLKHYKYSMLFENKYTIDKNNIINKQLLKKYCMTETVPSNILIQLIHNNEDIKKILSLYVNDVIFTLSSLNSNSNKDCITKITSNFFVKQEKIITNSGEYKNNDLYEIISILRNRNFLYGFSSTKLEIIFEYLKAISLLRNKLAHFDQSSNYHYPILRKELSNYIHKKGKEFLNNSKLNIELIMHLYPTSNQEQEIKNYYLYILDERDKNLGISIKKIMEQARSIYPSNLPEEENKKYNMLLKYHLYNYLSSKTELVNSYVESLRQAEFDEKDKIYKNLVIEIGSHEFDKVKKVCSNINFKNKAYISKQTISDILNTNYNWSDFTLEIYALTKFLTIKETNILVSSLIGKLESMLDLISISKKLELNLEQYINSKNLLCNLNELETIITQLRIVNSSKKYINVKKSNTNYDVLTAGLKIFKNNYSDEQLKLFLDLPMNNTVYKKKRIKSPIKNFIRNNVIKSKEFNYIFRYTNTTKISNLLYKNPKLVRFLLNQLSEKELEKYQNLNVDENSISNITLDSIITNLKNGNMDYSNNIKLYLKCLYFLIKNMVNINSYYFIAFSFYDRDMKLVFGNQSMNKMNANVFKIDLTKMIKHKNNLKQTNITIHNFEKLIENDYYLLRLYRNSVEHININTYLFQTKFPNEFEYHNYFQIYHYCMQKNLLNELTQGKPENGIHCQFLKECKNNIEKYHKYSKNLLYVMNSIFMYNYARYKDISDEKIFIKKYNDEIEETE